jgi:hypothetical protein
MTDTTLITGKNFITLKVPMLGPLVHLVKVGLEPSRNLGIKSGKEEESRMFE